MSKTCYPTEDDDATGSPSSHLSPDAEYMQTSLRRLHSTLSPTRRCPSLDVDLPSTLYPTRRCPPLDVVLHSTLSSTRRCPPHDVVLSSGHSVESSSLCIDHPTRMNVSLHTNEGTNSQVSETLSWKINADKPPSISCHQHHRHLRLEGYFFISKKNRSRKCRHDHWRTARLTKEHTADSRTQQQNPIFITTGRPLFPSSHKN